MAKMIAAVEPLAGKISPTTKATGTQRGKILSLNVMVLSLIRDRYRAM